MVLGLMHGHERYILISGSVNVNRLLGSFTTLYELG